MKLLEIFSPQIETFVRYKVLDPSDVDDFVVDNQGCDHDEYTKRVLDLVVYNLRSDVVEALSGLDDNLAQHYATSLYHGCVMLNPGLDINRWLMISMESLETDDVPSSVSSRRKKKVVVKPKEEDKPKSKRTNRKITRAKFKGLEPYLKESVIGQDEAIDTIVSCLRRSIVGLGDDNRPLGVFLFMGPSGIGKTFLAKQIHKYLYGESIDMVRFDMGEYQHKHENQKLTGSPNGYVGFEDGGQLTNAMKEGSHRVVLLDEVEKAHPDIWDTFMSIFDEGMITDNHGEEISFKDSIIILTSNLGNKEAVTDLLNTGAGFNKKLDIDFKNSQIPVRSRVERTANKAMMKYFRPELLNRLDNSVIFNYLGRTQMLDVAKLELEKVEAKLKKKGISLHYSDEVLELMVEQGTNPIEGARGLSKVRRDNVEDMLSETLLSSSRWPRGTVLSMSVEDDQYVVEAKKPQKKKS